MPAIQPDQLHSRTPIAQPPWKDEVGMWHVSGYDDARRVLSDPDTVVEQILCRFMQRATGIWPDKFTAWPIIFELMNLSNGPRHTTLRRTGASLIGQIQSDLDEDILRARLHAACATGDANGVDVISSIIDPTMNDWIARDFQLKSADLTELRSVAAELIHTIGQGVSGMAPSLIESQSKALVAVCCQTFGRPKAQWRDEEFAMLTLFIPGLTAISSSLINVLDHLASRPALQEELRRSPELIKPVLSEAERLISGLRFLHRTTGPDGVELASCHLPGGQSVVVDLTAASRDPARWDNPQEFDASRLPESHLNFGFGVHRCLGINISRRLMPQFIDVLLDTVSITPAPGQRRMVDTSMDHLVALPLHFSRHDAPLLGQPGTASGL